MGSYFAKQEEKRYLEWTRLRTEPKMIGIANLLKVMKPDMYLHEHDEFSLRLSECAVKNRRAQTREEIFKIWDELFELKADIARATAPSNRRMDK
jgi:desulfoferrodoxin (superoxide reductase-like protein)